MFYAKSIIPIVVGSVFVVAISLMPGILVAEGDQTLLNDDLILAQAQSYTKASDHKGHDKRKGKDGKHSSKKKDKKDDQDYAHRLIFNADTLNLSNEQLGKIVRLHLKFKKEHAHLKADMKKSMMAFKKETSKLGASDVQLKKRGRLFANALDAMVKFHIHEREALHAVLSDEQLKKLDTIKVDHHDHDGGHDH